MSPAAVVTIVHDRLEHLRNQHRGLLRSTRAPDDHVVVAIDDPEVERWTPPGTLPPHVVRHERGGDGLPLAGARNLGARVALERGAELLIFLDVDCIPSPRLVSAYAAAAHRDDVGRALLCGPVAYLPPSDAGYDLDRLDELAAPHPARPAPVPGRVVLDRQNHRLFWSLSCAMTRQTWETIGGFDESYRGYGAEDTDFGQRAAALGIPLAWIGAARAFHQFHPVSDPPVEHVDDIVRNASRFHDRWGFWPMADWLDAFVERGLVGLDDRGSYVRLEAADRMGA